MTYRTKIDAYFKRRLQSILFFFVHYFWFVYRIQTGKLNIDVKAKNKHFIIPTFLSYAAGSPHTHTQYAQHVRIEPNGKPRR